MRQATQLRDWLPVRVGWQDERPFVDWCFRGDERLTEPFFDQTVQRLLRHPLNQLCRCRTPLDALAELHDEAPGLAPAGFIFHLSRCGSTLVGQMLAALAQNIVISEAGPIDAILRARFHVLGVTDDERRLWLRWIVSALGRQRTDAEAHYFIKFDCWNTIDLPLVRAAFPDVPWVFVYREPVEVLVSHMRRRGAQMLPWVVQPQLFGLELDAAVEMPPEEYSATVLAAICRAALANYDADNALVVNYRQLPAAVTPTLTDFFRVAYTAAERAHMQRAAERDAKNPVMHFTADSNAKQEAATVALQRAADSHLGQLYKQLEDLAQRQAMPART